jgi:hypothetical protein
LTNRSPFPMVWRWSEAGFRRPALAVLSSVPEAVRKVAQVGTFSKWRHSGVSWWTVGVVYTKLAGEMQSIKCFSARWLGNTRRAPAPGARSKTVHSKYRPMRKCPQAESLASSKLFDGN